VSTITPSTAAATASAASSIASSAAFERFAIVFALATPVLYVICELVNLPLFTYHPMTGRIDLGWAPPIKDQGPAMHWYGWTATTLLGAGALGLVATVLPQSVIRKIPLSLIWILPLVAIPIFVYALRSFWRF
jgi:hypothetical protein